MERGVYGFSSTWLHGHEERRSMEVGQVILLSAKGRSAKLGSRAYILDGRAYILDGRVHILDRRARAFV